MKEKKFSFKSPKYITFFLSLVALALFILASSIKDMMALSISLTVLGAILLLFGIVYLYITSQKSVRANFFLYDRRRKLSITQEALTYEFADDNLGFYLSTFVSKSLDLWNGLPRELLIQLQAESAFVPLVAFKMLHDVSLLNEEDILPLFLSSDERTVAFVCRSLKTGGEKEMADFLFDLKQNVNGQEARVAPFFIKNKRYFEGKTLQYIKKNIDQFDFDE